MGWSSARAKNKPEGYDLGLSAKSARSNRAGWKRSGAEGGIPVLSSLALGSDGEYYNINADQMASACAVACRADTLIFLTDVPA